MRRAVLLLLVAAAGCEISPPCQKVASALCTGDREGDACAFLLTVQRGDRAIQDACRGMIADARALKANPRDPAVSAAWQGHRRTLATFGFQADERKDRIDEKLKAAGGKAGSLVDKAQRISADSEQQRTEAAEHAFDAVNQ